MPMQPPRHPHAPSALDRREMLALLTRLGGVAPLVWPVACRRRDQPAGAVEAPLPPALSGQGVLRQEGPRRSKIALCVDSLETPMRNFQQVILRRLVRAKAGMDLVSVQAGGRVDRQIEQLRAQAAAGAGIILVYPVEAAPLVPVLMELKAAGTLVLVFSHEIPEKACTAALFVDPAKIGTTAGRFVVSALRQKAADENRPEPVGRVVQITGPEGNPFSTAVSTAFQAALAMTPGVVLVHDAPANWAAEQAGQRFQDALRLQKKFDVVFCHSDFMAYGAARAARASQPPVRDSLLVLGIDGNPGTGGGLQMVVDSEIDATVHVPPLIETAWDVCLRALEDPAYVPKPRQEFTPQLATLEVAERLLR